MCSSTLFALAKQSKNLGAYKMARTAYDKLQVSYFSGSRKLQIIFQWQLSEVFTGKHELSDGLAQCRVSVAQL